MMRYEEPREPPTLLPIRAPEGYEACIRLLHCTDRWIVAYRPIGRMWWATANAQTKPDAESAVLDVERAVENEAAERVQMEKNVRNDIARWGSE